MRSAILVFPGIDRERDMARPLGVAVTGITGVTVTVYFIHVVN
jgi:hypothetical protein